MPLFAFAELKQQFNYSGEETFMVVMPFEGRYDNGLLPIMQFDKKALTQKGLMFAEGEVREMHWINLAGKKEHWWSLEII
jgi:hypothetical protein